MLVREAYTGTRAWNVFDKHEDQKPDHEIIDYQVPSIIDRETFDAVQTRLGDRQPRSRGPRLDSAPSLFGGLIRCGCCGHAMTPATGTSCNGSRYAYYKCASATNKEAKACAGRSIRRDTAEAGVMGKLVDWLIVPERLTGILAALHARTAARQGAVHQRIGQLQQDAADAEKALANLYHGIESGVLDPAEPSLQARVQKLRENRDLSLPALDRAKATLAEQPAIDAAAVEEFAQELARKLSSREIEAGRYGSTPSSTRSSSSPVKFELSAETTTSRAAYEAALPAVARFAALIGSGGGSRTRTCEGIASGFTVRPLCRSGHSPALPQANPKAGRSRLFHFCEGQQARADL